MTLTVIGNGAIDHEITPDSFEFHDSAISFSQNGQTKVVPLEVNIPPQAEQKLRIASGTIDDVLEGTEYQKKLGGGVANSAIAFRGLASGMGIIYLDPSYRTHESYGEGFFPDEILRQQRIKRIFLDKRPLPKNVNFDIEASVGGHSRRDNFMLKGHKLRRIEELDTESADKIDYAASQGDILLLNSPKDPAVVERALKSARDDSLLYAMVTDSLPRGFVLSQIVPCSTLIIGRNDLERYAKSFPDLDPDSKDYFFDLVNSMKNLMKPEKNLYVTWGSNGLYCADSSGIHHIALKRDTVNYDNIGSVRTKGAGDYVAAAIVFTEAILGFRNAPEVGLNVSQSVLSHHIYRQNIPTDSFTLTKVA